MVTRDGVAWGRGNWMKVVKRYKLPVISTRDVMDNMINIMNTDERYL